MCLYAAAGTRPGVSSLFPGKLVKIAQVLFEKLRSCNVKVDFPLFSWHRCVACLHMGFECKPPERGPCSLKVLALFRGRRRAVREYSIAFLHLKTLESLKST